MSKDTLEKITADHVRVIRGRMALAGMSIRSMAAHLGVSTTTVSAVLNGQLMSSRHLGGMLHLVGLPTRPSRELLSVHAQLLKALRDAGGARIDSLRPALAALEQAVNTNDERGNDV